MTVPGLFRVARPAGHVTNLAKTAIQVVIVWTFALVLLPWLAVSVEAWAGVPRWDWRGRIALGGMVFALGSVVGLAAAWCMATLGKGTPVPFDAARELVVAGPYRVVRNPMAVSAIVQTIGIAVMLGSVATLVLAAGGGLVWNTLIRPPEERFLHHRFGPAYDRYRAEVRCWIPRWPPYSS
ncbi:MAG TPA: isoprenylcysteine carboxylmethyltransferase family protein [Acidimicrobiales bacterium]